MIFSDRAEEAIRHNPPLPIATRGSIEKEKELPDRVYGLKETNNLKMLLNSADRRVPLDCERRLLRETLEVSPFTQDGEPLLFPFLILEAKSGKGGSDLGAAEMQTAFCIRRLLKLQYDLLAATGEQSQRKSEPLIWFFAYIGEIWSLAAGFVNTTSGPDIQFVSDICSCNGWACLLAIQFAIVAKLHQACRRALERRHLLS